jgi:hypothetical protein
MLPTYNSDKGCSNTQCNEEAETAAEPDLYLRCELIRQGGAVPETHLPTELFEKLGICKRRLGDCRPFRVDRAGIHALSVSMDELRDLSSLSATRFPQTV